jgi:hypothetical protein
MVIASFQKGEAYGKITDPRNISNVSTNHKLTYSSYTYVLADHLKKMPWYAFGLNPRKLGHRMNQVCRGARSVLPSDFSRFDGSLSKPLRDFERSILARFFNPVHHDEVLQMHERQVKCRGYTKFGVGYDIGYSRLSGSPDTALFNSLINALIAYTAYRVMGKEPQAAYDSLGLYGGDDGLSPDMSVDAYSYVCKKYGLKFTGEPVEHGPVTFLGRTYHCPWADCSSTIDMPRCLSKLHFTVSNEQDVAVIMYRKALSLQFTDPHTPLLGSWARNVIRVSGQTIRKNKLKKILGNPGKCEDYSWYYREYSNGDGFIQPPRDLVFDTLARELESDDIRERVERLESQFDQATSLEDLWPSEPIYEPVVKEPNFPIVKDGMLRGKPQKAPLNKKKKFVHQDKLKKKSAQ